MVRLDKLLFEKGLVDSREKAQALIMAGKVLVEGRRVDKPGTKLRGDERIELLELPKYVSRAGEKLEGALRRFGINPSGKVALDVGSSTGGFTDCLLQHGAKRVYAVDVGKGQLDIKLRNDPRVVLYEKTDARALTEEHIPERVDIVTVDVSFISLTKVLPNVLRFLRENGTLLALVKPQFELCPKKVRKGIVRDPEDRREAILKVAEFLNELGFHIHGVTKAFPRGSKGNEEFFLLAGKERANLNLDEEVERALREG
ncbi:TlyA family RNA methyltransferase [Hydrogenivirga sp.]